MFIPQIIIFCLNNILLLPIIVVNFLCVTEVESRSRSSWTFHRKRMHVYVFRSCNDCKQKKLNGGKFSCISVNFNSRAACFSRISVFLRMQSKIWQHCFLNIMNVSKQIIFHVFIQDIPFVLWCWLRLIFCVVSMSESFQLQVQRKCTHHLLLILNLSWISMKYHSTIDFCVMSSNRVF